MKKRNLIILGATALFLIVLISIIIIQILFNNNKSIEEYNKYEMTITITSDKENFKPLFINVKEDGQRASVKTNFTNQNIYILDKSIHYVDQKYIYKINIDKSYRDIYSLIKNKVGTEPLDQITLQPKEINEILEAIFFENKTNSPQNAIIELKNNKINSFEMTIDDIKEYENLKLKVNFQALEDEFVVDTKELSENILIPAERKTTKETNVNILEIKS